MIAIIDYGMGNLRSVQKALESVGARAAITQDTAEIRNAQKVVLPGVGAMQPAMEKLNDLGLLPVITETIASGKPFLGICLGLQLLFEKSSEGGDVRGLGILEGSVEKFTGLKVPHMGWNQLKIQDPKCPLFAGIQNGTDVYFCHSYYVNPADPAVRAATTDYGSEFTAAVAKGNLYAVQFHPEKSQSAGLNILKNFTKLPS
jgi:glutamine amidotransferase